MNVCRQICIGQSRPFNAGACVGLFPAIRGDGPNTALDLVHHVAPVAWLLAGVL
jgi:hypothetical protein